MEVWKKIPGREGYEASDMGRIRFYRSYWDTKAGNMIDGNEEHKKIWGKEIWIVNTPLYCMKKLYLHKGYKCSMHHHKIKDETFIIETGIVGMEANGIYKVMLPGDKIHIPPNTEHRFWGLKHSSIIEVSTQHLEDDSYRSEPSGKIHGGV